jgi:hypothetical protein
MPTSIARRTQAELIVPVPPMNRTLTGLTRNSFQ